MVEFSKLVYPELSYKLTGILFTVHNELGRFCNEKQYADCMESYFKKFGVEYKREKVLPSFFEGELEGRNKVDFYIGNKIFIVYNGQGKSKKGINFFDYQVNVYEGKAPY